jgi:BirA family biotin operon repressor/biotin-[acetyl-CoA-carboxylase] ligase
LPISLLDSSRLQRELNRGNDRRLQLHYFESCESTNIECMSLQCDGSVVIAEQQTHGRGRRGRHWYSPATRNIYCSLGIEKTLNPQSIGMLSIQVGVTIARVLKSWDFRQVELKWPNDILLLGKKLGGILIETRVIEPGRFYLVVGFGLNIELDEGAMAVIDQPAIALTQLSEKPIDRNQLLRDLILALTESIDLLNEHRIEALIEEFNQLDPLQGSEVRVKTRQDEWVGTYRGIQTDGQIQIEIDQQMQVFSAADISLRGA